VPGVRGFFRWLKADATRLTCAFCSRNIALVPAQFARQQAQARRLNVRIDGASMPTSAAVVDDISTWIDRSASAAIADRCATVPANSKSRRISHRGRLGYLTLERRRARSRGEAQRIHLASALGSLLVGTLYALDEPTVGSIPPMRALLAVLRHLRDLENRGSRRARFDDHRCADS